MFVTSVLNYNCPIHSVLFMMWITVKAYSHVHFHNYAPRCYIMQGIYVKKRIKAINIFIYLPLKKAHELFKPTMNMYFVFSELLRKTEIQNWAHSSAIKGILILHYWMCTTVGFFCNLVCPRCLWKLFMGCSWYHKSFLWVVVVLNNQEDMYSDVHSPAEVIGALRSRRWVISQDQQVLLLSAHLFKKTQTVKVMWSQKCSFCKRVNYHLH